ncbi:hypothetical protein GGE29_002470 [Agrobacterium tumefaciens]|nr:hypothetical protein [Agrobacterium radiobacter]MBB4452968.1 hypothetical protein [Agrobacterium radiobacter]MBP2539991.1 hypothetical protein [Agrobacterium tumefaciens]MCP2136765.1 hypothetical protein [Rhizobium sp. SLBN-94]MDR6587682.1 hypothetical protein [Agrobacterium tumefaciens]
MRLIEDVGSPMPAAARLTLPSRNNASKATSNFSCPSLSGFVVEAGSSFLLPVVILRFFYSAAHSGSPFCNFWNLELFENKRVAPAPPPK